MSNWTGQLANGVKEALAQDGSVRIAVHSEAQAGMGKSAAGRMARNEGDAARLTFEVIPEDEWERYPIGAILV